MNINTVKSGIYIITNTTNGKQYVGSAINIAKRWREHTSALRAKRHDNRRLQYSWNKHTEENFKFEILAQCPKEYLIKMEQFFIDTIKPIYNLRPNASSQLGFKHSVKSKNKLSIAHKGKRLSIETKAKLSIYGKINNTQERLKAHWENSRRPVFQYTLEGVFVKKHESITSASVSLGVDAAAITKVASGYGKNKTCLNFQFSYLYKKNMPSINSFSKRIIVYKNGEEVGVYNSISECAKKLMIGQSNLTAHLKGRKGRKTVGGYTAKEVPNAYYKLAL